MITIHAGKLGVGKSYSATKQIWKLIHQGQDCYANWKIDFTDYFLRKRNSTWYKLWNPTRNLGKVYYWENLDDLYKLTNGEVFFDEAHMAVDSRDFATLPKEFKRKLTQSRKYGLNLHFISQHSQQIDIAVRRLANDYVLHKKFWRFFTWKEWDGEAIEILANPLYPQPKSSGFGFYWFSKRFAKSYDTFALFKKFDVYSAEPMWSGVDVLRDIVQKRAQEKALSFKPQSLTALASLKKLFKKGGD